MKKPFSGLFIALLLIILLFVGIFPSINGQGSTEIKGMINSNTVWTKAEGPYNVVGNILVNNNVKLTIEAGVNVVYRGDYNIQVNGTLVAIGTISDPIIFNGEAAKYNGIITFAPVSQGWDEKTQTGSIIKNAFFTNRTGIEIVGASPLLTNNTLSMTGLDVNGGRPLILSNHLDGMCIGGASPDCGAPIISNNIIEGNFVVGNGTPTISYNTINGLLEIKRGMSTITNNIITSSISVDIDANAEISNNLIGRSITVSGHATIINNQIISRNQQVGIRVAGYEASISRNLISNCSTAITGTAYKLTIQGNNIIKNQVGIRCESVGANDVVISNNLISNNSKGITLVCPTATIRGNTIINNEFGISIVKISENSVPTIQNNNIYANSQYNLRLGASNDINANPNWWGSTNSTVIDQGIYDYNDDFQVGKVNFVPILNEANPQALPDQNVPLPDISVSPSPTADQSGSGEFFGLGWLGVSAVVVVIVLLIVGVWLLLKRKVNAPVK
jgi:hypothetical protein